MNGADGEEVVGKQLRKLAFVSEPEHELRVEGVVHVRPKRTEAVEELTTPEGGGLWDVPGDEHPPVAASGPPLAVRRRLRTPDPQPPRRVSLLDVERSAREPAAGGWLERSDHRLQCAGQEVVVAVQIGHDLSRRTRQPLVDRVGLPGVRLGDPPGEAVLVAAGDLHGLVRCTAIDDHVLEVRVALVQDGADRPLDETPLVERWGDDRELGQHRGEYMAGISLHKAGTTDLLTLARPWKEAPESQCCSRSRTSGVP